MGWLVQVVIFVALFASMLVLATVPFRDVTRQRVQRFAQREQLPITAANGMTVISYLATTRRWRGAGLLASVITTSVLALVHHDRLQVSITSLFIGWFVGAVIAEWRISVLSPTASRRSATLAPRRLANYLAAWVRWAAAVSAAGVVLVCAVGQAFTSRHVALCGLLLLALTSTALVWLVGRHILERPQPALDPGVRAADESIRSRSLHVLAGSIIAICAWIGPVALELVTNGVARVTTHDAFGVLSILMLALGGRIAVRPSMAPSRVRLEAPRRTLA